MCVFCLNLAMSIMGEAFSYAIEAYWDSYSSFLLLLLVCFKAIEKHLNILSLMAVWILLPHIFFFLN